jgi:hypothetical protein
MSAFPDWQKFVVKQKRPQTGCIPTGYETILRAAGVKGVDFVSFQDDFDLDKDKEFRPGVNFQNNFESVANAVKGRYPHVTLKKVDFPKGGGDKKLAAVEGMVAKKRPVLISLALTPRGGWHIMPVVDSTDDSLILLHSVNADGAFNIRHLKKNDFVLIHDNWPGGDDIAFLED